MDLIGRFALQRLSPFNPSAPHRSRLLLDGDTTPSVVYGESIKHQFACGKLSLIITHYDYFDGVSHWFYLVGPTGQLLDAASTPDYFGFLDRLDVVSSTQIGFSFHGTNDRWSVSVDTGGFWSLDWSHVARRLNRFICSRRFLTFHCVYGPPWKGPAR